MRIRFMASAKQIAWRKKFGKLYGKKKKGAKSKKSKKPKSFKIDKKTGSVSSPSIDKKYKAEFKADKHDKPKTKSWKA